MLDLVYKRSSDGGETWSDLAVLYGNSTTELSFAIGNAAPVQDRDSGLIIVPFIRDASDVRRVLWFSVVIF